MPLHRLLRLRYSLRALLVFITLFGLYAGYHGNRAFKERKAEAVLLRGGAKLTRYPPPVSIFPYRFVFEVHEVSTLDSEVAQALADLPFLKILSVDAPQSSEPNELTSRQAAWPRSIAPPGAIEQILAGASPIQLQLDGWTLSDSACLAIRQEPFLEKLRITSGGFSENSFATAPSNLKRN